MEGSACTYSHPYLYCKPAHFPFTFPTYVWISFTGVSSTISSCMCGKIQKLQIHKINLLGDLLVKSALRVYSLFSFVIDDNLDLQPGGERVDVLPSRSFEPGSTRVSRWEPSGQGTPVTCLRRARCLLSPALCTSCLLK